MKKLLFLTISLLACVYNSTAMTSKDKEQVQKTEERIAEAEARIEANKLKEQKLINTLFEKADEIKHYANRVRKAELSLGGLSGLGRVEQMKIKAERYAIEKKSRKKLQLDFESLYQALQDWKVVKRKIKEDEEVLKLREVIESLEAQRAADSSSQAMNQEDYQDYTLQEPATLQEVSSYNDVLNDPTKWRILYDANLEVMKKLGYVRPDPDIEVPSGITLVVPNQPEMFIDTPGIVAPPKKAAPPRVTKPKPDAKKSAAKDSK